MMIAKTIRLILYSPIIVLGIVALSSCPAWAEGYPGLGDRLQYAESLPHYNLGNRYLNKQWYEKAVEKYRDAINIYPYDADVYINLGLALKHLNDAPRAEWAYKRAIELKNDDWTALSNLANLYMLQERFGESSTLFNKALKCKDLPSEEREVILSNLDGIKKIMKNKGLLDQAGNIIGSKEALAASGEEKVGAKSAKGTKNAKNANSAKNNKKSAGGRSTGRPGPKNGMSPGARGAQGDKSKTKSSGVSSGKQSSKVKSAVDKESYNQWLEQ